MMSPEMWTESMTNSNHGNGDTFVLKVNSRGQGEGELIYLESLDQESDNNGPVNKYRYYNVK